MVLHQQLRLIEEERPMKKFKDMLIQGITSIGLLIAVGYGVLKYLKKLMDDSGK